MATKTESVIEKPAGPAFAELLQMAMTTPGVIQAAYSAFHNYSAGNQLAAAFQCAARGLAVGPIDTFKGWQTKGRTVSKGAKAITLCMPIVGKKKDPETDEVVSSYAVFVWRRNWFVLAQTEGDDYVAPAMPAFDTERALAALGITRVAFDHPNGNCQGYASAQTFAVNPVAGLPAKTMFHEIGHIVLGHTAERMDDTGGEITPRDIREVEAEGVALLCVESLGLPGADACRGYMQNWRQDIPERSARRIMTAATKILTAGRPVKPAKA